MIKARDKEITAYHEAGHALVAWALEDADRVHKISIVARGHSGGATTILPEEESSFLTAKQARAKLAVFYGGRVAEELIFKEITTGACSDISRATELAQYMIKSGGMSEGLGARTFGKRQEMVFLGRGFGEELDYGVGVANSIDREIHQLINKGYYDAKMAIVTHQTKLVILAEYLIEHETLRGEDMERLFAAGDNGLEEEGGSPAIPPETPPYAPQPSQPTIGQPATSLSIEHYQIQETDNNINS